MYGATDGYGRGSPALDDDIIRRRSFGGRSLTDAHSLMSSHHHPPPPPVVSTKNRFTRSVNRVVKIQKLTSALGGGRGAGGPPGRSSPTPGEGASPLAGQPDGALGKPAPAEEEPAVFPSAWNDLSHDLVGVRNFVAEGKFVFIPLVITTALALSAIATNQGSVVVFTLSFVALLPLAMQLGDLTEMLSGW